MNFKKFNRIIEEGGAYGHMANVHEDYTLQFEDLQNIIRQALTGGIQGTIKEKTDGQALAVGYRAGIVRFARNKGHYRGFGKDSIKGSKGVINFFKDHPNENVKEAFSFAAKDLEKAIQALSDKQKQLLFGDGKRWINIEVIWPATVNVIPYNHELLVLHNFREYDEEGNVLDGDFDEYGRMMAGMIKQVNQDVQNKFTITSMPMLKLPQVSNFEASQDEYLSTINNIMSQYQLNPTNTIGDYWVSYMSQAIANGAKQFNYIVQPDALRKVALRWAYKGLTPGKRPREYNATALKNIGELKAAVDNMEFVQWVSATEKSGELKGLFDNMNDPLKTLFLKLGVQLNKNISNLLTLNPDEAVQDIRRGIEEVTREIESTGDMTLMAKLQKELNMIEKLGGLKEIVPTEGLTFTYTPKGTDEQKIYKFTGIFAPVNQILGSLKFAR
jgi:hypothetical protein